VLGSYGLKSRVCVCVCACARAENRERDERSRGVRESSHYFTYFAKRKKGSFHRSHTPKHLSCRPFLEISKRIFDSRRVDLQIFHERKHALEHIKRAPLFFYASARALERRERDSLFFFFFFEGKARERERERSSFVLRVSKRTRREDFPLNCLSPRRRRRRL
jgi:hypothetical protein